MFSKVLGKPQPDWHSTDIADGILFLRRAKGFRQNARKIEGISRFGRTADRFYTRFSAAVMDARDFFEESIEAARILNRRAVMLYGIFNEPPEGLDENIVAFDYAPFSQIFPRAACVVHQGGVGTTAQVFAPEFRI